MNNYPLWKEYYPVCCCIVRAPWCRGTPSLSIADVHRCVDETYRDEASRDIDRKISNAHVRNCTVNISSMVVCTISYNTELPAPAEGNSAPVVGESRVPFDAATRRYATTSGGLALLFTHNGMQLQSCTEVLCSCHRHNSGARK